MRTACWLVVVSGLAASAAAYDPLERGAGEPGPPIDLDVLDSARGRTVPIRVFLPDASPESPRPVILFSHGLGGSRSANRFLADHWSRRGFVVVCLQHPGSDDTVWREVRPGRRMGAMRDAASLDNFRLRVGDVVTVLDQLAVWHATAGHPLAGRCDLERVGMSGHSFGAQTTQAVSGQSFPLVGRRFTDDRIRAAVILSPGTPQGRSDAGDAFASVTIPWLLATGTDDVAAIGGQRAASRRAVFPALPAGLGYELVLDGAEHSAFSEQPLPGDRRPRNPNHHRALQAITTAFWDATLGGDADARAWLDGNGPRSVLEAADEWQHNRAAGSDPAAGRP